jgi:hypothetical protein
MGLEFESEHRCRPGIRVELEISELKGYRLQAVSGQNNFIQLNLRCTEA